MKDVKGETYWKMRHERDKYKRLYEQCIFTIESIQGFTIEITGYPENPANSTYERITS